MADKYKILIIDDDELLLDMYAIKFREQGFEVETACSGTDGVEKIKEGIGPDIILVDLVMPNMDGFEFLNEIKEKNLSKSAKIIILSNLGQESDIKRGLRLGADDYIIKAHFTPSEIIKKILELLKIENKK